jgi:hypothetical protein
MNDPIILTTNFDNLLEKAAARLVTVSRIGNDRFVHLPIFYPSGAAATVIVKLHGSIFQVSDGGFAYREAELVGGEGRFSRRAKRIGEELGLEISSRAILAKARADQLSGTIAEVAQASATVAHEIVAAMPSSIEAELAEHVRERLPHIFGSTNVHLDASISGASTRPWEVLALVKTAKKRVIFDAVSNNHTAVFSTATKFRDIALLDNAPSAVAVIRGVKEMGNLYQILAQAGHVIEENAADTTFERAAAA